jgi:hypothetical protein
VSPRIRDRSNHPNYRCLPVIARDIPVLPDIFQQPLKPDEPGRRIGDLLDEHRSARFDDDREREPVFVGVDSCEQPALPSSLPTLLAFTAALIGPERLAVRLGWLKPEKEVSPGWEYARFRVPTLATTYKKIKKDLPTAEQEGVADGGAMAKDIGRYMDEALTDAALYRAAISAWFSENEVQKAYERLGLGHEGE